MSVTVTVGDTAVFVLDAAGRILAPPGAADRTIIAGALAQAAAQLAMLPATEPFETTIATLAGNLERIGTEDASALGQELADRLSDVAALMRAGSSMVAQNAIAAGERALGAVEH